MSTDRLRRGDHAVLARDFSVYSAVNLASLVLLLGTGLVLRRYIGPTLAGIWTGLELLPIYAANAHLGVFSAAERNLPFLLGARRDAEFEALEHTVFRFARALALGLAAVTIAAAFVLQGRVTREISIGLLAYGGIVAAQVLANYYIILLRARQRFVALSGGQGLGNLAKAVLVVAGAYAFGLYGIYTGLLAATALQLVLFQRATGNRGIRLQADSQGPAKAGPHGEEVFSQALQADDTTPKPGPTALWPLLKEGAPILLGALAFDTLRNADKLVIAAILGATPLGVYSVAALVCQGLFYLPNALSIVLYPRFQQRYGETQDAQSLERMVLIPIGILSDGLLIIATFIYLLGPALIEAWMPDYTGAIGPLRVLLFGTYVISLTHFAGQFLLTVRKQVQALYVVVPTAMLAFGTCAYGARYGMVGVALGASLAYVVHFLAINAYAARHFDAPATMQRLMAGTLASAVVCLAALMLADRLIEAQSLSLALNLSARVLAAILVSAPFAWRLRTRFPPTCPP